VKKKNDLGRFEKNLFLVDMSKRKIELVSVLIRPSECI